MPPYAIDAVFQGISAAVAEDDGRAALMQMEQAFHALMGVEYRELSQTEYEALALGDNLPTGRVVLRDTVDSKVAEEILQRNLVAGDDVELLRAGMNTLNLPKFLAGRSLTPEVVAKIMELRQQHDGAKLVPGLTEAGKLAKINVIQALERCLQTYRGIDHVLQTVGGDPNQLVANRSLLNAHYRSLVQKMEALWRQDGNFSAVRVLEAEFNGVLLNFMVGKGLVKPGLEREQYQEILKDQRFHAGLLDPVPSSVTVSYMTVPTATVEGESKQVQYPIYTVAHPITRKTAEQRQSIDAYSDRLTAKVVADPQNISAMTKLAYREQMKDDTRGLPAQARKTDPYGVKNGYVRHVKVMLPEGKHRDFYFMRSAAVTYVGKEKLPEGLVHQTKHNLEQAGTNAAFVLGMDTPLQVHPVILTTHYGALDTNGESTMYNNTTAAAHELGAEHTYAPQNEVGTFHAYELPGGMTQEQLLATVPFLGDTTQMGHRSEASVVAGAMVRHLCLMNKDGQVIAIVMCASGQDRTGNADELATEAAIHDAFAAAGIELTLAQIQMVRAATFEEGYLATAYAVGSVGQKTDSDPNEAMLLEKAGGYGKGGVLSEELIYINFQLLQENTKTNKNAKVSKDALEVVAEDTNFAENALIPHVVKLREELINKAMPEHIARLRTDYYENFEERKVQRQQMFETELGNRTTNSMASRITFGMLQQAFGSNKAVTAALRAYVQDLASAEEQAELTPDKLLALDLRLLKAAFDHSESKDGSLLNQCIALLGFDELAVFQESTVAERACVLGKFLQYADQHFVSPQLGGGRDVATSFQFG